MIAEGVSDAPGTCATPVPLTGTVCGLPLAVSVYCTVALLAPAVVGVKVTLVVQVTAEAKVVTQLVVRLKSPGLVPDMATALMVTLFPTLEVLVVVMA
jgi:hypothetical protein